MVASDHATVLAAGVRIRRDDGQVLLVRHRTGIAAGRWSVPFIGVSDDEVAEAAATRVLRDVLHLDPGYLEFAETLSIPGADEDVVINVFDALGWTGEPRFNARDLDDAGWVDPANTVMPDLVPEVAAWLSGGSSPEDARDELARMLIDAREELLAAYDAIPFVAREYPLDAGWAPVDVLHNVAVAEAYTMDEALRLIEVPGHIWQPFSARQAEADRRIQPRPSDSEVREQVLHVQTDTLRQLETLATEQLARYVTLGNREVVSVRSRIVQIAEHDHEHTAQLRAMRNVATARF